MTQTVRITIEKNRASVTPPLDEVVRLLQYRETKWMPGGRSGYRCQSEQVGAVWRLRNGDLLVPAGSVPMLQTKLMQLGHRVDVDDRRKFGPEHEPNWEWLEGASDVEKQFVAAIQQNPVGRFQVAGIRDVVDVMAVIAEDFPNARIVIAVATRREVKELHWRLKRLFSKTRVSAPSSLDECRLPCQLAVVTFPLLQCGNPERWHFILLPNAGQAMADSAGKCLTQWKQHRLYGFQAAPAKDARTQLRLEMFCGPVIYSLTPTSAEVQVVFCNTPWLATLDADAGLDFKRQGYWHQDSRNILIAAIAKGLAKRDRQMLRRLGTTYREDVESGVAVLVESIEHGQQIQQLLPDWELGHLQVNGMQPNQIITEAAAWKSGVEANVIVRATGTSSPLQIKGFPPTTTSNQDRKLLIDFDDTYEARTQRCAKRRLVHYENAGWKLSTCDLGHYAS